MAELIGFPLLAVPVNGQLGWPTLADSVRQSIEAILRTRPGEQLMRPNFGAGLANLLHEPNTLATRRRIRDLVQDALARWEPRILLDRVEVWEIEAQPDEVRVEIVFRLRRTGAAQSLGLTLNLEGR
jgi:phage baseplate assembly protein W